MPNPRILVIHRKYRLKGGEDVFVHEHLVPTLKKMNGEIEFLEMPPLFKSLGTVFSDLLEFKFMFLGLEKLRPSYFTVKSHCQKFKPTHVIFNNFIPTVSLAAPAAAKQQGARTYSWVHNGRLSCANGLFFDGKDTCHKCLTNGSRSVLFRSCFTSFFQRLIYSWVYRDQRVKNHLAQNIDEFICVSEYARQGVMRALPQAKASVVYTEPARTREPMGELTAAQKTQIQKIPQPFLTFIGRLSFEKGIDIFLEQAKRYPQLGFVVCGDGPEKKLLDDPALTNVAYFGFVDKRAKNWLFENTKALVISSRVPENAPMILFESQPYGTPVLYCNEGGTSEVATKLGRRLKPIETFAGQVSDFEALKVKAPVAEPIGSLAHQIQGLFS